MAESGYGLWPLVALNTVLVAVFATSFLHQRTGRDWRAMGAFTGFLVALFTEIYGAPLTVYLLGSWLGSRFPALRATHAGGHLWNDLIGGGFWLTAAAWQVLHEAARAGGLASTGRTRMSAIPSTAGCC